MEEQKAKIEIQIHCTECGWEGEVDECHLQVLGDEETLYCPACNGVVHIDDGEEGGEM